MTEKTEQMKKMHPASNPFQFKKQWELIAWNYAIGANNRLVLLYLISKADHDNGADCYPSVKLIAQKTEMSERAVQRSLASLEAMGIIVRNKRIGYTNLYEFCDPSGFNAAPMKLNVPTPASMTPRQSVTPDCVTGEGCQIDGGGVTVWREGGDCVAPNHNHIPSSSTPISDRQAAATRTPASAPAHEGQPAAAAGQDFDLGQPDRGRQAASEKPAQTSTAQHGELSAWLVGELKARKAELVRTDAPATPSQVKVCVAAVVALAAGDEGAARRYIEDRLTGFALRGEGRPKSLAVLLGFLVDRGDFAAWERERQETSAQHGSMRRPAHSGSGHYNDPAMKALADIIVM